MEIFRRGRLWHLRKRVPRRFEAPDLRRPLVIALKTDSEIEARLRAVEVERELGAYWLAPEAGAQGDAAARFRASVERATRRGVAYRSAADLADGPLEPRDRDGQCPRRRRSASPPSCPGGAARGPSWSGSEPGRCRGRRLWRSARHLRERCGAHRENTQVRPDAGGWAWRPPRHLRSRTKRLASASQVGAPASPLRVNASDKYRQFS